MKAVPKSMEPLGANSTIVCGTTVGAYAFVGAGAVVSRDVPAFALVVGVPAQRLRETADGYAAFTCAYLSRRM